MDGIRNKTEAVLLAEHDIQFIKETAGIQEAYALEQLQTADVLEDQMALSDEVQLWRSVRTLISQRDRLLRYTRELTTAPSDKLYDSAVQYLKDEFGL